MKTQMKMFQFIAFHTKLSYKPLHISFDKIDGFNGVYNGTRYLVLFGCEKMISFTTGLYIS